MIQQDYLMRLLLQFFQAMARSWELNHEKDDPEQAADMIETAIGNATEMDGATLLSLSPDSIAQIMRATDVDPNVTQFIARSMLLESVYLAQANHDGLAALRMQQAHAIAAEYAFELPEDPSDFDSITQGLEQAALNGGFSGEVDEPPRTQIDDYLSLL